MEMGDTGMVVIAVTKTESRELDRAPVVIVEAVVAVVTDDDDDVVAETSGED